MKKNYLLIFALLIASTSLLAQNYSFFRTSATYTDLTNPISLNNGEAWDDPEYMIPIGFDIPFFESSVDTLYILGDGGGSILTNTLDYENAQSMIIPNGADLVDRGFITGTSVSPISYQITGNPGSRILKVEWKNAGFYNEMDASGTLNSYINFQIWLYETTGVIEMRYGTSMITNQSLMYDFGGPVVALVPYFDYDLEVFAPNSIWLRGNANSPTAVTSSQLQFLTGNIDANAVYGFNNLLISSAKNTNILKLNIYPNPATDFVNITTNKNLNYPAILEIYDIAGHTVLSTQITRSNENYFSLNVSKLQRGAYKIILRSGNDIFTTTLIK